MVMQRHSAEGMSPVAMRVTPVKVSSNVTLHFREERITEIIT
jgi:hypothetical protein